MSHASKWQVQPSNAAMSTINKIRAVVDQIDMTALPKGKELISIAIGDPTKYPNLRPADTVTSAVQQQLLAQQSNGYLPSFGALSARTALAAKYSLPHIRLTPNDIILSSGCSDALNMAVCSLLNPGENILLPRPGFAFYETLASRYNFDVKFYDLRPENDWQIDIDSLRSQIDSKTRAILINNPSNPCGSVLCKQNLLDVLSVAERAKLPIISDEIYEGMVYDDNNGRDGFVSVASLSRSVPVLTLSGLSKQYLVPGWRVGWVVVHDPIGAMSQVRSALQKLSTVLLGPNSLVQMALPKILKETPQSYYTELNAKLKRQSQLMFDEFANIEGLTPIRARGAMYLMVKIDTARLKVKDDIAFANLLFREEAVLCLPGTIFNCPNYFRAVICPPPEIIKEIGTRMRRFCARLSIKAIVAKL